MKRAFPTMLLTILLACVSAFAQAPQNVTQTAPAAAGDTRIPINSRVFIAPMNGYENYLAAAFRNKKVPLIVVTDRSQADFEITGTADKQKAGWAKTIFMGDARSSNTASIQVVNLRTSVVAYADSSHRASSNHGDRSTAEKLAKFLKQKIEKDAGR